MKKLTLRLSVLFALAIGLSASQSACGLVMPSCESTVQTLCERASQCASPDARTQQENTARCMRTYDPQGQCRYLTPSQQAEFDVAVRSGCVDRLKSATCSGTTIDAGPTCNQTLTNFFTLLSAR
ncbi:hypothetical protein L6R29_01415 [Myxococcota bacterium]|nr:hypothetical protein [Myxococcota bacterium]